MNLPRSVGLAVALGGLVTGGFRAFDHAAFHGHARRPNVLVVTFDTTRIDHVSAFGYARPTTPTLTALAEQGFRFERAYSPMPATGPAHASLMTGEGPRSTGVVRNGIVLGEAADTLAEQLRRAGYKTAAVVSGYPLSAQFGLAQGFDSYDDEYPPETASIPSGQWDGRSLDEAYDRRADATAGRAIDVLADLADERAPFFLFVHFFDPHSPYDPPEPWRSRNGSGASDVDRYDGEIAFADAQLGRLLSSLRRHGREEETLVVFASDHGEGLGQHGVAEHGSVVYDEAVHVPLVFAWPGILPRGVSGAPVALADLAPTILDLVGLPVPPVAAGRGVSLTPILLGGPSLWPRQLALEAEQAHPRAQRAVTDGRLKLVESGPWRAPRRQLFDLVADPGERSDILAGHESVAAALAAGLPHGAASPAAPPELDAADAEALRALGYVD